MSSSSFYDEYLATQVKSGINERIHSLYQRIGKAGLKTDSNVWEIGCGIGALTSLLAGKVKTGRIEAIDLSPKSIAYAREHIRSTNVHLTATDTLKHTPTADSFDFILLFDVAEHIPLEQHPFLFQRISQYMRPESQLLINIPNPQYIVYEQKNNPAALQELDQPVYLDKLTAALATAKLDICFFETYSVWVQNDYQFMIIKKRKDFEELLLSRNLFQKGVRWLKRQWRRMQYKYPVS